MEAKPAPGEPLPFPESLCHSCAAPPRYVRTDRGALFIHCPVYQRYPPQPVTACEGFRPRVLERPPTEPSSS